MGRRSALRTLAMTGAAVAGGILVFPSPPSSADTEPALERPDGGSRRWSDLIVDEEASAIARFQYAPDGDGYRPTSPINVVFPLEEPGERGSTSVRSRSAEGSAGLGDSARIEDSTGLEDVMDVLEDAGWIRKPEEYVRYAWDRREGTYVPQQATAAQTYYGTSGRLHVRCWAFEDVVSMQAHADSGARPKHVVESYDAARSTIEALYAAAGWTVAATVDLDNGPGLDHDGTATVIRPEEST